MKMDHRFSSKEYSDAELAVIAKMDQDFRKMAAEDAEFFELFADRVQMIVDEQRRKTDGDVGVQAER